jgi:hypothetical protein
MSTCTIHIPFAVGDLISERATRRTVAHPRPAVIKHAPTSLAGAADRDTSSPATNSQVLRRWSIAELIAAATWPREGA